MHPGPTRVVPPESNPKPSARARSVPQGQIEIQVGKAGFESAQVSTAFTPGVSQENQTLDSWAAVAARTAWFAPKAPLPGEFFEKVSIDKLLDVQRGCTRCDVQQVGCFRYRDHGRVRSAWPGSKGENDAQSLLDLTDHRFGKASTSFDKERLVDRDDLRHVGDGVPR